MNCKRLKQRGAIGLILVLLLTMMPMEVFSDTVNGTNDGKQTAENVVTTASDSNQNDDDDGIPPATGSNQAPDDIPIIDDLVDAAKYKGKPPEAKSGSGWDFKNGVLTILDGSVLGDYSDGDDRPWESIIEDIEQIEISDGIDRIGRRAFEGCNNLVGVNLSAVTTLGQAAFSGCENLTTVNLSQITELGTFAFYGCTNLVLTSDRFHQDLDYIPDYAFHGCENLTSVNLSHITQLGTFAFCGCKNLVLTSDGFHPDLDYIPDSAFERCENLTSVNLSHITQLGEYAFYGCKNLVLTSEDLNESLYNIPDSAFSGCENLTTVNLSHITQLGKNAFDGCKNLVLTSDGFHPDLDNIPDFAFSRCENLTTVNLSHITQLGTYTFYGCKNLVLTSDGFHQDLDYIPDPAFYGCENLTTVNLSHITELGYYSFDSCLNLKAVVLPETKPIIGVDAFFNVPPLLLLIKGGQPYTDYTGFPEGSGTPYITGDSFYKVNDTIELTVLPEQADLLTCQWYFGDELLPGETKRTLTIPGARIGSSGRYECRLTLETVTVKISQEVTVSQNYSGGGSGDSTPPQGVWKKDAVGWWYEYPDGTYPRSEWKLIAGVTYYFHPSGYMATGWLNQNGAWYMLDPGSGRMIAGDWYLYRDDWYYFDKDGRMVTGWLSYNDNFYYLSTTDDQYLGRMLKDQMTPDGYQVDETGRSNRL